MATSSKPKLAITMGDPAGVGPELCLLALTNPDLAAVCVPVVFGDAGILVRAAEETGMEPPQHVIPFPEWEASHEVFETAAVIDLGIASAEELIPGQCDEKTGRASFEYLEHAITAARAGQVQGVVTCPISKEAWRAAGIDFVGHTELFMKRFEVERGCMLQISAPLTCAFVTDHVGYQEVPALLTRERILDVIELTHAAMQRIRQIDPKIVVCGLNPHAGEHGIFGEEEEERVIGPAVADARARGWLVEGPVAPDTAFLPKRRAVTDAFVCMYHDQGHIPLKALAFEEAVNTTLGLPVVRTSVCHGTALDIAWQGRVNPGSLFEAVRLAAKLARSA